MDTLVGAGVALAVVAAYVALMRWVLPRFGIQT
jgi:hypothetical protein